MTIDELVPELEGVFNIYELYIRHFDKDNNITKVSKNISNTHIHLYERKIEKIYEPEYSYENEDGSTTTIEARQSRIDIRDPSSLYDINITNDNTPILFRDYKLLNQIIISQLNNLFDNPDELNNKKMNIIFFSNDDSEDYNLNDAFSYFIDIAYTEYNINLNNKELILNPHQYSLSNIVIENTNIRLLGVIIFTLDTCTIKTSKFFGEPTNKDKTIYPSITVQGKQYFFENNTIEKGHFVHFIFDSSTDDELKWRDTSLVFMGMEVDFSEKKLAHRLNSFIKVVKTYSVQIVRLDFKVENLQMKLININLSKNVEVLNLDVKTEEVIKTSIMTLDSVSKSLISNINISSTKKFDKEMATKKYYTVILAGTHQLAEHSFTNFNIDSIGLIRTLDVKSRAATFINCIVKNFIDPIDIPIDSYINSFKFLNCDFENISILNIKAGTISLFETKLDIDSLSLTVYDKLFLQEPNLVAKDSIMIAIKDGAVFNIDKGLLKSKNIIIMGDQYKGKISTEKVRFEAMEKLSIIQFEKLSLSIGRLVGENISISANRINDLSSEIRSTSLQSMSISNAKITQSEIRLASLPSNTIDINFNKCEGEIQISSVSNREINLNVSECKLDCYIKYSKECEEKSKVILSLEGSNIGTSIFGLDENISIFPKLENENSQHIKKINDFKSTKDINLLRKYILYGNL